MGLSPEWTPTLPPNEVIVTRENTREVNSQVRTMASMQNKLRSTLDFERSRNGAPSFFSKEVEIMKWLLAFLTSGVFNIDQAGFKLATP